MLPIEHTKFRWIDWSIEQSEGIRFCIICLRNCCRHLICNTSH